MTTKKHKQCECSKCTTRGWRYFFVYTNPIIVATFIPVTVGIAIASMLSGSIKRGSRVAFALEREMLK